MTSAAPRGPRHLRATSHALAALLLALPGLAWAAEGPNLEPTPTPAPEASRLLPFGAEWARARGIDLPSPFGLGVFLVSMRRDIEVTDVRQVKGLEFDYVVMLDVNASSYGRDDESRHLFHIGVTRAAYQLWLIITGDPSPLVGRAVLQ